MAAKVLQTVDTRGLPASFVRWAEALPPARRADAVAGARRVLKAVKAGRAMSCEAAREARTKYAAAAAYDIVAAFRREVAPHLDGDESQRALVRLTQEAIEREAKAERLKIPVPSESTIRRALVDGGVFGG